MGHVGTERVHSIAKDRFYRPYKKAEIRGVCDQVVSLHKGQETYHTHPSADGKYYSKLTYGTGVYRLPYFGVELRRV